jgi:hypothetical protein
MRKKEHNINMTVFWDVAPCTLAETDRRGLLIALMMKAVSIFQTSVNFYHTTRRNIPKGIPSSYSSQ